MKKYILITGAYGGMGRKTVLRFSNMGYTVFALDKEVMPQENNVIPIKVDLTNEEDLKNAYETVRKTADHLDLIVHFAGVYMLDSLVEIESAKYKKIFNINVIGAYFVNKTFLPMLKNGSKIIITTSELAPLSPLPFTGVYAVTKAALDKYAYSLRMELQLLGISVSVLRAGAVETDMLGASMVAIDEFQSKTKLYSMSASRFKKIVNSVESRCVKPEKIAEKIDNIFGKKKAKFVYTINRNPLLLLFNVMPMKLQFWIIKKILE